MTRVFADAFYFVARLNRDDPSHHRANQLTNRLRQHLITTEWALAEVADAIRAGVENRRQSTGVRGLEPL